MFSCLLCQGPSSGYNTENRGSVQDTFKNDENAVEFFCKYDNLCRSESVNCVRGGACVKVTQLTRPRCICDDGYRPSANYSDCLDTDECASDPCPSSLNASLCFDEVNSYRCECLDGFTGDMCETNIDDCHGTNDTCSGTGDCVDEIESFSCDCFPGYTGELCEVNIDECELMDEPCYSNGTCVDGIDMFNCTCSPGHTGERCEYGMGDCALVDEPCSENGVCADGIDTFNCTCFPRYTGQHCEFIVNTTTAEAQVSSSDNTLLIGVVVGLVVLTLVASVVVYRILRRQGETVLDSETAVRNTEEANNTYEPPPPVANKVYSSSDSSDNDDNN